MEQKQDFRELMEVLFVHQLGQNNINNENIILLLKIIKKINGFKGVKIKYFNEEINDYEIYKVDIDNDEFGYRNEYFYLTVGYLMKALETKGSVIINQLSFIKKPINNCFIVALENNNITPLSSEECENYMNSNIDYIINRQDNIHFKNSQDLYLSAKIF